MSKASRLPPVDEGAPAFIDGIHQSAIRGIRQLSGD